MNWICGFRDVALVPPTKEKEPEFGVQGLPLKITVHKRVTLQVFVNVDASVQVVMNGIHPAFGESVKLGTGGTSIHTVAVWEVDPQLLETVKVTVYVPGNE